MDSRYERYTQFLNSGSAIIPITYIAEVLRISYTDAVCDLQEMASLGYLGPGAYINYRDKTLVLKNFTSENKKNTANNNGTAYRPVNARQTVPYVNSKEAKKNALINAGGLTSGKSTLLLIGGILLLLGGIGNFTDGLDMIFSGFTSWTWISEALSGLLYAGVGGGMLGYRHMSKKRSERVLKYMDILRNKTRMDIAELADYTVTPVKSVRKDLEFMLKRNLLGSSAHFSSDHSAIIMTYEEPKVNVKPKAKSEEKNAETPVEDRYDAILKEIRQLNDDIADEAVSERIYKIEDITSKIFNLVKERPEKESELKTFMSYYLPTTLKLLRSYSLFEKQGIKGENIDSTLSDIERILDTLVEGFSQQLDRMFESDALDISSDIEVLESMMQQDGLFGGSAFQVAHEEKKKDK